MNTDYKINLLTAMSSPASSFRPHESEINQLSKAGLVSVERRMHERTGLHFYEHDNIRLTAKGRRMLPAWPRGRAKFAIRTLSPKKTLVEKLLNRFAENQYLIELRADKTAVWGTAPDAQFFESWEDATTFARYNLASNCEVISLTAQRQP